MQELGAYGYDSATAKYDNYDVFGKILMEKIAMTICVSRPIALPTPFPLYGDEVFAVIALSVASLAIGKSTLGTMPECEATQLLVEALQKVGVPVQRNGAAVAVQGVGLSGFQQSDVALQTGNNGLVLRALLGLLAGLPHETVVEAQGQLARRSLVRVIEPLAQMGVHVAATYKYTPPLHVFGVAPVQPIQLDFPLPNFYLKFSLLLAALFAEEESVISEPTASISHLEHLLTCADVQEHDGRHVVRIMPQDIEPFGREEIPMDTEIADFLVVASALQGKPIALGNVLVNPSRASALNWLLQHTDAVAVEKTGSWNCEAADISLAAPVVLPSAIEITGNNARQYRNALPMIAALCAGHGVELRVHNALDIRQNHCDWIAALVDGLSSFGVEMEEHDDGFVLRGTMALHGAGVACYDDESIALAMLALAVAVGDDTVLYDVPATPKIQHCLAALGLQAMAENPENAG